MMSDIRARAAMLLRSMGGLPNQRFFTPRGRFWRVLREVVPGDVDLVDAGCGRGDLIVEGAALAFDLIGIDISPREGQNSRVVLCDAVEYDWGPFVWPLICRPSHDGWVADTVSAARKAGATVLYVSTQQNYKRDLGRIRSKCLGIVGLEGERMYLIPPYKYDVV